MSSRRLPNSQSQNSNTKALRKFYAEKIMKVVSVMLFAYHEDAKLCRELASAFDLSSFGFFQRGSVEEFSKFLSREMCARTPLGLRQSVQEKDSVIHVHHREEDLVVVTITDEEYPPRVAFSLNTMAGDGFSDKYRGVWTNPAKTPEDMPFPELEGFLAKYQDPVEADKLSRITRDLEDTKKILHRTIEQVLERGDKLDNLVERSDKLSTQSKQFYKVAKKQNSCCTVQ